MPSSRSSVLTLLFFTIGLTGGQDLEWGGMFEVGTSQEMIWVAQKVDGSYAETTMKVVIYPSADTSEATFDDDKDSASLLLAGTCIAKLANAQLAPSKNT